VAVIRRLEDIEAWQKSRELTRIVYQVTSRGEFARDFALRDQIRRSAISVMSNIAEGYERDGDNEFRQFLANAKGSAGETRSHLYVALDAGLISEERFQELYALASECSRLISGFMRYLAQSELRGPKYK
jgi:four helix bundle protein